MIFQPAYPSSGFQVGTAHSSNAGRKVGTHPGQDALPSQCTLTPTLTQTGATETPIHLMCASLGCERKLESLEKTHADVGRMCQLHTDTGPSQQSIFFSLTL